MVSPNFLFTEGNSINRSLMFNGEGYHYWKTHMQIFIEVIDLNIWEAIEIGPFIPTMVVGNTTIDKPIEEWDDDESRRVQYNLKAKNIITSALGMDEHFRVSNCKNAKEI